MDDKDHIITDLELDHIVKCLKESGLEEIGSKPWIQQMSMFEELNVQAALEATRGHDGVGERVKEALVDNQKIELIVREMLLIELWREEILKRILQIGEPDTVFQVMIVKIHLEFVKSIF